MKIPRLFSIALIAVSLFVVSGCTGGDRGGSKADDKEKPKAAATPESSTPVVKASDRGKADNDPSPVYPKHGGKAVNDFAGQLKPYSRDGIEALLKAFNKKTGDSVVVVVIDKTTPATLESYATGLFNEWGIGEKGKNNGVLLLLAKDNPRGKQIRIEVGYGLENALTDADAAGIIADRMVPFCKRGDFDNCVTGGATAIVEKLASARGLTFDDIFGAAGPPPAR